MKTINEFCSAHSACAEGREWALAHCTDMIEVWQKAKSDWLVWVATRSGVLTERDLRLFACWSVRQVWHLLTDERSRSAVEVSERYAAGDTSLEELVAACAEANDAAWDAAWNAASASASSATRAAAWAATRAATRAAAKDAAKDATEAAAWAATRAIAKAAQADWLRANTKPTF